MDCKNNVEKKVEIHSQIQSWYVQWLLVDRLYSSFAQRYGITSTTMFVLRMLLENTEDCTQHIICDAFTMPKQTVSSLLDSLEKSSYIEKRPHAEDKRNKVICLTEKGREFAERIVNELDKAETEAFLLLSEQDRKDFTRINEALTQALVNRMSDSERVTKEEL